MTKKQQPSDFPFTPSIHAIRERIALLRCARLERPDVTVEFLKDQLLLLFKGYTLSTPVLKLEQKLFRGIKYSERPSRIHQLTYPPAHLVLRFQRANRPGQSMFYCSVAREPPFFELNCRAGERIVISRWRVTQKLWLNNAGYSDAAMKQLQSSRDKPPFWQTTRPVPENAVNRRVHEFFAREFTRSVDDGEEHLYKISVAITEKLLGELTINEQREGMPKDSRFAGIIYPSISMRGNSDNVALRPEFVDRYLRLERVEYIRIDSVGENLTYQVTNLDFADSFAADGTIEWKGRNPNWKIPSGAVWKIGVEHGKWVARNEEGRVVEPT